MPRIRAEETTPDPLCPYCRDALADPQVRCSDCGTRYHSACSRELPRCATLGCAGKLKPPAHDVSLDQADASQQAATQPAHSLPGSLLSLAFALACPILVGAGLLAGGALGGEKWGSLLGGICGVVVAYPLVGSLNALEQLDRLPEDERAPAIRSALFAGLLGSSPLALLALGPLFPDLNWVVFALFMTALSVMGAGVGFSNRLIMIVERRFGRNRRRRR